MQLQRLFEFSRDLMCVASMDGYFKVINPAFLKLLGYTEAELTSVPFLDLVHPSDRQATVAELEKLQEGKEVLRFENRYRCKDGTFKWLAWVATPQVDEGLIYAVARDVTDNRLSLHALLADLPGMVYRCRNDDDWTMTFMSSGCHQLTGYRAEELIDDRTVTFDSIVHPDDRTRIHTEVQRAVDAGREFQLEYRIETSSGAVKYVSEKGRAIYNGDGDWTTLQGYIFDVTDRRKLESELNHLQRMDSLGQLTGGVAHDFNNLLTIIIGNLELLEPTIAHDADGAGLVRDALDSAWRGADLCRQLLAFGRRQMLEPELLTINDLVLRVEKLIRRTVDGGIEVEVSLEDDLPQVVVDPAQLENAILNLAINARDAMPDGGLLHVRTTRFSAGAEYAEIHPDVEEGEYVVIEVGDTGAGMSRDVLERAFEPFFTTKEQGKGTGLGLSMVYGLLKQSGGHVRIYSEVGHGTSVKLYIPIAHVPDTGLEDTVRLNVPVVTPGGDERILVVEDDPGVRKMVVTALTELGYAVVQTDSGTSALEYLDHAKRSVDLLFTDVVMPGGVDGVELATRAKSIDPELKILLTSGFSKHHIANRGPFALLNKPYHKRQLAAAVRQLLDS